MSILDKMWGGIPRSPNSRGFRLVRAVFGRFLNIAARHLPLPPALRVTLQRWRGVHIGKGCFIGGEVFFDEAEPDQIAMEDDVTVIARAALIAHAYYPRHLQDRLEQASGRRGIIVRRGAYIGFGAIILPGVEIGENAIVAAGTIVARDVPSNSVIRGAKAEVVKTWNP